MHFRLFTSLISQIKCPKQVVFDAWLEKVTNIFLFKATWGREGRDMSITNSAPCIYTLTIPSSFISCRGPTCVHVRVIWLFIFSIFHWSLHFLPPTLAFFSTNKTKAFFPSWCQSHDVFYEGVWRAGSTVMHVCFCLDW